jgi:lactate permease
MAVTNLPGEILAPESSILLGLSSIACGAVVAFVAGGWKGLLRTAPPVLVLSLVMGVTQHLLVTNGLWTLGATGGAMMGLVAGLLLCRIPAYHNARDVAAGTVQSAVQTPGDGKKRSLWVALSAYGVLVVLAFGFNLIPAIESVVNGVQLTLPFPELTTGLGWVTKAELGRKINLFGHPGAILLYSSLIAYFIYSKAGYFKPYAAKRILIKMSRGAVNSSLGIVAMVGMAVVMSHAGMTNLLAQGLSQSVGKVFYPAVAPFLGALGAFITGSNNNSNVLFAALQMRTAELLGLSTTLILAAQTAGGSLGSVLAPAKVIVGCSTVGLGDNEGVVMRPVLLYGIFPILLVAVLTVLLGGI